MGACRSQELRDMRIEDIEEKDSLIIVNLPKTKTNIPRKFVLNGKMAELVMKYRALRPTNTPNPAFFLQFRNGKCTVQVIGKHTIALMSKSIATFLRLSNPEKSTGHCFRRTSATIFANEVDFINLKDLGGWKSDTVTQRYIQKSIHQKEKICNVLANAINLPGEVKPSNESPPNLLSSIREIEIKSSKENISITNCVVHVHNYVK